MAFDVDRAVSTDGGKIQLSDRQLDEPKNFTARIEPVEPLLMGQIDHVVRADDRRSSPPAISVRIVAEQDVVQRTMARLSETLRLCLLLSVVAYLSTAEIAEMLHLEEATVRQRLARARKQFQQFYALESGEEVIDNAKAARDVDAAQKHPGKHQNHLERVESHSGTDISQPSTLRRNHAERFYRDPAVTPLW